MNPQHERARYTPDLQAAIAAQDELLTLRDELADLRAKNAELEQIRSAQAERLNWYDRAQEEAVLTGWAEQWCVQRAVTIKFVPKIHGQVVLLTPRGKKATRAASLKAALKEAMGRYTVPHGPEAPAVAMGPSKNAVYFSEAADHADESE